MSETRLLTMGTSGYLTEATLVDNCLSRQIILITSRSIASRTLSVEWPLKTFGWNVIIDNFNYFFESDREQLITLLVVTTCLFYFFPLFLSLWSVVFFGPCIPDRACWSLGDLGIPDKGLEQRHRAQTKQISIRPLTGCFSGAGCQPLNGSIHLIA